MLPECPGDNRRVAESLHPLVWNGRGPRCALSATVARRRSGEAAHIFALLPERLEPLRDRWKQSARSWKASVNIDKCPLWQQQVALQCHREHRSERIKAQRRCPRACMPVHDAQGHLRWRGEGRLHTFGSFRLAPPYLPDPGANSGSPSPDGEREPGSGTPSIACACSDFPYGG